MTPPGPQLHIRTVEHVLRGLRRSPSGVQAAHTRTAAVYVLFSGIDTEPIVTLIRRAATLRQHQGEYAFPGGGVEAFDRSVHDAALREVKEELGVGTGKIEPWGELEPELTVSSGFLVVPFTGRLDDSAKLTPAPEEVAEVVRVPLACFVDPVNGRTITRLAAAVRPSDEPEFRTIDAYAFEGRVIWGATARIIGQVVTHLRAA